MNQGLSTRSIVLILGTAVLCGVIFAAVGIYFCARPFHVPCLWQ